MGSQDHGHAVTGRSGRHINISSLVSGYSALTYYRDRFFSLIRRLVGDDVIVVYTYRKLTFEWQF